MTTYAHTETGFALDPWPNDTQPEYEARFAGIDKSQWHIVSVPDGTRQGAKDNGDGTYTNPSVPSHTPQPSALSGKEFFEYAVAVLMTVNSANKAASMLRYGQIIAAMLAKAATDPMTAIAETSYRAALAGGHLTFADAEILIPALEANGAASTITSAEATAILANWPTE